MAQEEVMLGDWGGVCQRPSALLDTSQDSDFQPVGHPLHSSTFMKEDLRAREELDFAQGLSRLREDIVLANVLIREANLLAAELGKQTSFSVTLRIPPSNLAPSRVSSVVVAEPAILVQQGEAGQSTWSLDKMDAKIILMREMYKKFRNGELKVPEDGGDPFNEVTQSHTLIGVANLYLDPLFYNSRFVYGLPVVSPQGEIVGKLQVELEKVGGELPQERLAGGEDQSSETSEVSSQLSRDSRTTDSSAEPRQDAIQFSIKIRELVGVPVVYSEFVYCEFSMVGVDSTLVLPRMDRYSSEDAHATVYFDFKQTFTVPVTEELLDFCYDRALSIQVLGQKTEPMLPQVVTSEQEVKVRSLEESWHLVSRRLRVNMEVQEINEEGDYSSVEVIREEIGTAGHFQLRQGQQKRIKVDLASLEGSGGLPLELESIVDVSVGAPALRNKTERALDSYQEGDLHLLRETWSRALEKRKLHLQSQIQEYMNLSDKSPVEEERENSLLQQLMELMEEQNTVYSPPDNSSIPGSTSSNCSRAEEPGVELHQPTLFIDSASRGEYSTLDEDCEEIHLYGQDSLLSHELGEPYISLPIVQYTSTGCTVAWDTSLYNSTVLNRLTDQNSRVYMIARITVRVSQPCVMDLVLRKRFSFIVHKQPSLTNRLWKRIGGQSSLTGLGVVYNIVYNLPRSTEDLEKRESLAAAAAAARQILTPDGDTLVEKYSKGVRAVSELLRSDQIRQSIALKELLAVEQEHQHPAGQGMRKTYSVPNMRSSLSCDNILARNHHQQTNISPAKTMTRSMLVDAAQNLNDFNLEMSRSTRRLPTSRTMSTLHEEKSGGRRQSANPNSTPGQDSRWKGDSSSLTSSGYESKVVSESNLSIKQEEADVENL